MSMRNREINYTVECLSKSDKEFHVRKYCVKNNLNYELKFSLKKQTCEVLKNGEPLRTNISNVNFFFAGMNNEEILDLISTEANRALYQFVWNRMGAMGDEVVSYFSRGLLRLLDYPVIELFYFYGFKALGDIWLYWRDKKLAAPHKVLGCQKYMMKYLKEMSRVLPDNIATLNSLHMAVNGNNVVTLLEIFLEESDFHILMNSVDLIVELYRDYDYRDVKRLGLYATREVKLEQGITSPNNALVLLRDYARMCKVMGREYEKYPKSLKKVHDIAQMNYQVRDDATKTQQFTRIVELEGYKMLEYKDREYVVVIPQSPKDLIDEGSNLSHCVASYVDDVINGKCKIVFLRSKKEPDVSLVTVEVRGNTIRQVKGKRNRRPSEEEMAFISKWAKKKGLLVNIY
jgi:hypothetical protein